MQPKYSLSKCVISLCLISALLFCNPICAIAQSKQSSNYILDTGTPVILRVDQQFNSKGSAETGVIPAVVETDVYSADGTTVLISAGTPASIEFDSEENGSWGKAGKICMTYASTKSVDNKRIPLRLSTCKKGRSKIGDVIVLSVVLFPLGLISGCMKGSMPIIQAGTIFNTTVAQDTPCDVTGE